MRGASLRRLAAALARLDTVVDREAPAAAREPGGGGADGTAGLGGVGVGGVGGVGVGGGAGGGGAGGGGGGLGGLGGSGGGGGRGGGGGGGLGGLGGSGAGGRGGDGTGRRVPRLGGSGGSGGDSGPGPSGGTGGPGGPGPSGGTALALLTPGPRSEPGAGAMGSAPTNAVHDGPDPVEPVASNSVDAILSRLETTVERVTARLAEAEATTRRLLASLAHVPEGVVIADQSGTVVYRNPQAAGFVGARHGEALAERALGELLASALAGNSNEENLELFSPPRRTLAIRARPLVDGGRPGGAVAIIEDVSEKRRLEAVRRDFVANISHELKTPVGALSLVAETLEGEDDPAVVARLSHRMRTEAERLGRIIEDLLDLSRIESEESPSRDPVPVHTVVCQAVDRLRPVAEHQAIRLEVEEPSPHLIVRGDRRQLVSAIHNLVDNAIKYSEGGSAVQVGVTHDDRWIEITVADHGIGIPSRDLERVFERFYRVDRARSRDTGGTGLGLSIVRHVAGNHGGEVTVESREGEGSTFRLRLPNGARATARGRNDRKDD